MPANMPYNGPNKYANNATGIIEPIVMVPPFGSLKQIKHDSTKESAMQIAPKVSLWTLVFLFLIKTLFPPTGSK